MTKKWIPPRREAEAHHALGELYLNRAGTTGVADDYDHSKYHFDRSRALRERLVSEVAGENRYDHQIIQRDLARSHGYLGDLYLLRGDVVPKGTKLGRQAFEPNFAELRQLCGLVRTRAAACGPKRKCPL
jgi:hypothetical protein